MRDLTPQQQSCRWSRENSSLGTHSWNSFFHFYHNRFMLWSLRLWWKYIRGSKTEPVSEPDMRNIKNGVKWWNTFYEFTPPTKTWQSSPPTQGTHSVLLSENNDSLELLSHYCMLICCQSYAFTFWKVKWMLVPNKEHLETSWCHCNVSTRQEKWIMSGIEPLQGIYRKTDTASWTCFLPQISKGSFSDYSPSPPNPQMYASAEKGVWERKYTLSNKAHQQTLETHTITMSYWLVRPSSFTAQITLFACAI